MNGSRRPETANQIEAAAVVVQTVLVGGALLFAWRQLVAAREPREATERPFVVVDFTTDERDRWTTWSSPTTGQRAASAELDAGSRFIGDHVGVLVAMTGLPGSGKSAVADAVSGVLRAPVFSVDPLEAALNRAGIMREQRSDYVAYDIAAVLAGDQLRRGFSAVVDAVNGKRFLRDWWRAIALEHGARCLIIATAVSDPDAHRRRIERRHRGIDGFAYELSWADVMSSMTDYEPHDDADVVVDTAASPDEVARQVVRLLEMTP